MQRIFVQWAHARFGKFPKAKQKKPTNKNTIKIHQSLVTVHPPLFQSDLTSGALLCWQCEHSGSSGVAFPLHAAS